MLMLLPVALTSLCFVVLLAGYRVAMRPWFCGLFFALGLGAMASNSGQMDLQLLTWVKVITLAASVGILLALARGGPKARRSLACALAGILALNILEAVAADALAGNWINMTVGISLIATMTGPGSIGIRRLWSRPAVTYDLPWSWICAYTAWNFTVVCGHYPLHYLDHVAVLSAPILAAVWAGDRRLWLEARGFTLGVYATSVVLAVDVFQLPWIPESTGATAIYPGVAVISAGLAAWNLVARFRPTAAPAGAG